MAATDLIGARKREAMLAASRRWEAHAAAREANEAALTAFGAGAAEPPIRQARFDARQAVFAQAAALRARGALPVFIERKIGPTLDFMSAAPSEAARRAGRPVARIVGSPDPRVEAHGFASGFLVHPELMLTNWHVFPDKGSAAGAGANFLHEQSERGLERGLTFALDPDRFFFACEELDFALVAVAPKAGTGEALSDLGAVVPTEATAKILVGQPINIVQHPDGGEKRYATRDNRLLDILDDGFIHYATDTLEGSSGSPAFSGSWELVGLHHAGIPEVRDGKIMSVDETPWSEEMGDDRVKWIANEGVRIGAIVRALAAARMDDPAQAALLRSLLGATADPADEISTVLANEPAAPPVAPCAPKREERLALTEAAIAGATFSFSGPVTINVYPAPPPAPVPTDAAAPASAAFERSIRFDPDYAGRRGYDPAFLGDGLLVPMPEVAAARDGEMYKADGRVAVLPYHHYSLALNAARRLPMWSASNVDYDPATRAVGGRATFGRDRWVGDPRVPAALQLFDAEIYAPAGQIDRGHIVRRQDSAWGATPEEIEFANSDTFHWTNCTPQHAAFNRASPSSARYGDGEGVWGGFEMYVQRDLGQDGGRACMLAGPVLAADDPVTRIGGVPVQVPLRFWKVVAVAEPDERGAARLRTYGFVMSQKDVVDRFGIEFAPGRFARFQKPLSDIGDLAGILFDPVLLDADAGAFATSDVPVETAGA